MKFRVVHFGAIRNKNYRELHAYYVELVGKYAKLESVELKDRTDSKICLKDIEKKFSEIGRHIVLSPEGRVLDTLQFCQAIQRLQDSGVPQLSFYLGNANGFEKSVVSEADEVWSLSPLTFGHELALVVLAEQLFRVLNRLNGGSYHR